VFIKIACVGEGSGFDLSSRPHSEKSLLPEIKKQTSGAERVPKNEYAFPYESRATIRLEDLQSEYNWFINPRENTPPEMPQPLSKKFESECIQRDNGLRINHISQDVRRNNFTLWQEGKHSQRGDILDTCHPNVLVLPGTSTLFARRRFEPGDIILEEQPFVFLDTEVYSERGKNEKLAQERSGYRVAARRNSKASQLEGGVELRLDELCKDYHLDPRCVHMALACFRGEPSLRDALFALPLPSFDTLVMGRLRPFFEHVTGCSPLGLILDCLPPWVDHRDFTQALILADVHSVSYDGGQGLYLLSHLLTHSCEPNTRASISDSPERFRVIVAAKPIRAGEMLTLSYLREEHLLRDRSQRWHWLWRNNYDMCGCSLCGDKIETRRAFMPNGHICPPDIEYSAETTADHSASQPTKTIDGRNEDNFNAQLPSALLLPVYSTFRKPGLAGRAETSSDVTLCCVRCHRNLPPSHIDVILRAEAILVNEWDGIVTQDILPFSKQHPQMVCDFIARVRQLCAPQHWLHAELTLLTIQILRSGADQPEVEGSLLAKENLLGQLLVHVLKRVEYVDRTVSSLPLIHQALNFELLGDVLQWLQRRLCWAALHSPHRLAAVLQRGQPDAGKGQAATEIAANVSPPDNQNNPEPIQTEAVAGNARMRSESSRANDVFTPAWVAEAGWASKRLRRCRQLQEIAETMAICSKDTSVAESGENKVTSCMSHNNERGTERPQLVQLLKRDLLRGLSQPPMSLEAFAQSNAEASGYGALFQSASSYNQQQSLIFYDAALTTIKCILPESHYYVNRLLRKSQGQQTTVLSHSLYQMMRR
jgi:hypothetical protein